MRRIAFIGCGKKKRRVPCAAYQMYEGALFQKTLTYCKQNFDLDSIFILSAKYGLVSLDTIIEPYDETLNKKTIKEREEWSILVKNQIKNSSISGEFWFFAGENYVEFFNGICPMQGMPIGKRLQWLNRNIKKGGFGL